MLSQIPGLLQNVFHGAGTVTSTNVRYGTESAEIVAALGNAQVGPARTGGHDSGYLFNGSAVVGKAAEGFLGYDRLCGFGNIPEAAHAQNGIYLRQLLKYAVLVPFAEAAGNNYASQFSRFLKLCHLKNVVYGLALGGFDKAAGIDYDKIRPLRLQHEGKAGLAHKVEHLFAVYKILGTAKRYHSKSLFHFISCYLRSAF